MLPQIVTVKSGVLLWARLQYCDAVLQYLFASCSDQIAIALTSHCLKVQCFKNIFCKFSLSKMCTWFIKCMLKK